MTTDEPQRLNVASMLPSHLGKRLEALAATEVAPSPTHRVETPQEAQERAEARRQVYAARWAAQVPPMYADADMGDLAQDFTWQNGSLNLVLAGPVGTGKTHHAYAIGNAMVRNGTWCQAVTVVDLLAALRPDGDLSLVRAVRACQVLILDDLSASKASEWAQEQMTDLLDRRIREGLRTIATTNSTETDLEAAWGGRFMDRLRYRRTVVVLRGESRRKAEW